MLQQVKTNINTFKRGECVTIILFIIIYLFIFLGFIQRDVFTDVFQAICLDSCPGAEAGPSC